MVDPRPFVRMYIPTDPRLGRHVAHDPRSRNYALAERVAPTKPITWPRNGPILDQGQIGSCTSNAALGLLMTVPFSTGKLYTEDDALALYHTETVLDDVQIPGVWPPDDTGSAAVYAMQALKQQGLITGYLHAFSLDAALGALNSGPIAVGSVWLNSMFTPDRTGLITVDRRSPVAGGHEYVVDSYDPTGYVGLTNSWGTSWGQQGRARLSVTDFGWLLSQQGDVCQPAIPVAPAPPNPAPPAPSKSDVTLWTQVGPWAAKPHVGANQRAANAINTWAKTKGFL